jgi:hypothetical protein
MAANKSPCCRIPDTAVPTFPNTRSGQATVPCESGRTCDALSPIAAGLLAAPAAHADWQRATAAGNQAGTGTRAGTTRTTTTALPAAIVGFGAAAILGGVIASQQPRYYAPPPPVVYAPPPPYYPGYAPY